MGTAQTKKTDEQLRHTLHEMVESSRTIVLLTRGEDGKIVGRPMANVRTDEDTTVYLVTNIESKKIDELRKDPRVSLSLQTRHGIAIIYGEFRISQDRKLIDELWEDQWSVWFEGGKHDPAIAILIVEPREGTFWEQDLKSGVSYLWRMLKARVTGETMEMKSTDQAKVDLRKS